MEQSASSVMRSHPQERVSRTEPGSCDIEGILISAGVCDSELGLDNSQGSFLLFAQVFPVPTSSGPQRKGPGWPRQMHRVSFLMPVVPLARKGIPEQPLQAAAQSHLGQWLVVRKPADLVILSSDC